MITCGPSPGQQGNGGSGETSTVTGTPITVVPLRMVNVSVLVDRLASGQPPFRRKRGGGAGRGNPAPKAAATAGRCRPGAGVVRRLNDPPSPTPIAVCR